MGEIDDFDVVFGNTSAYDQRTIGQIISNRRSLENELFIDRLLQALGVQNPSKCYPPDSHEKAKHLHHQIASSESPDHHKHSVLYYLIKDTSHASRQAPEEFAKASYLPEKYKTFIDGIWFLDRLKFEKALDYLTEPSLIPTFPEEILYTLCRHAPPHDVTLPIAYYQTVSPPITSTQVLETYFLILCRSSITEAYFFSCSQGEMNHRVLFEQLITFVLAQSKQDERPAKAMELVNLPLDDEDQARLKEFLNDGKGRNLPGAMDTLTMRGVAIGRPISEHWKGGGSKKIDGLNWAILNNKVEPAPLRKKGQRVS